MTETETLYRSASEAETMRRDGQSNPSTADVLRAQRDAAEAVIIRLVEHIDRIGDNGVRALISARDAIEAELTEAMLTPEQLQPTQAQRRMMEESRERQARYTAEHAGLATPEQMAEMNQADKEWEDMHDEN